MMFRLTIYTVIIIALFASCSAKNKEDVPLATLKKAPNIILLIGDGMGISQITAAMYSSNLPLNLERFNVIGLQKTNAYNNLITDSAAASTAFSTGKKTNNGALGVNPNGEPLKNIIEYLEENDFATGLVATSQIAHATPAGFFAHHPKRAEMQTIAAQLLEQDIDLIIGGGQNHFENRTDRRNLSKEMEKSGYQVESFMEKTISEIQLIPNKNLLYFTAASLPLTVEQGRDYLPIATDFSIDFLNQQSESNFFLMIEASQIDWGGHAKNSDYIINETLDFDEAIGKALNFAEQDGNTLVIVTSDHETGGYGINYGSTRQNLKTGFTSDYHTAQMVPVFAYGRGAEKFAGIYENTAIFDKMMEILKIDVL